MKKISLIIITILSITGLITSTYLQSTYNSFNSNMVVKNIEHLSSNELRGRLPGTEENEKVALEIESVFQNLGLSPLGDSYKKPFTVKTPVSTGELPSLKLRNGQKIIKDFVVGQDFKEDMLNFQDNNITFTKNDTYEIYKNGFAFYKNDSTYFFSLTNDKNFSFRSSFYADGPYSFVIQINSTTFNEILDGLREGFALEVSLPYEVEEKTIYNVCGMIEGSNPDLPPLVFTAHFDHVGSDSIGNIYGGALDNASGASFLIELAKTISSRTTPNRDIVFVALNAEEFGLLGSKDFSNNNLDYLKDAEVINFDMVGSDGYPITFMNGVSYIDKDSSLQTKLEDCANKLSLENNILYQDASDHASFCNNGINSITISHSNMLYIHTPEDTYDKISAKAIENVYYLVEDYTLSNCYSTFALLFYNTSTLVIFGICTTGALALIIIELRKKIQNT